MLPWVTRQRNQGWIKMSGSVTNSVGWLRRRFDIPFRRCNIAWYLCDLDLISLLRT